MPKKSEHVLDTWKSSRIAVFGQVTAYTIIIIAVVAGGGYLLDQQFDTFPALFITGLVIGFPLTQLVIYKKVKKYARGKHPTN